MKKLLIAILLPLFIAGCTTGKVHDTQIHQKCSYGSKNIKSSVKKHLDCQDELRKEETETNIK